MLDGNKLFLRKVTYNFLGFIKEIKNLVAVQLSSYNGMKDARKLSANVSYFQRIPRAVFTW